MADPRVLVDAASRDDAAVFRLSAERALVASTDFFTPIVDDPATWGAIAAANALSDLYAMGATPLFALDLVGWPRETLPLDMLGEVIRGATAIATAAGCPILGGHSIDDPEPKFGLVVLGEAHPDELLTNAGANPGDAIILTKAIGTGILTTALKRQLVEESDIVDAIRSMTELNAGAARVALAHGVKAATDVTGFGLAAHLIHILEPSGVAAHVGFAQIPLFEGVLDLAAQDAVPGGTRRNLAAATQVTWDPGLSDAERLVCVDAQTSGGLLLIVPEARAADVLAGLRREGVPVQAVIGRIIDGEPGTLTVDRSL